MGYASLKKVKSLLNIPDSVTAPDEKINDRMVESDNYVNVQINLHATTPIANPDLELITLSSSLAASTYNYWQTPAKDRTLDGMKQWEKRIQNHIKATYKREDAGGTTADTLSMADGSSTGFETSSAS